MNAEQIIYNLPKALIGWYDFSKVQTALYVGHVEDSVYEEIKVHVPDCVCLRDSFDEVKSQRFDLIVCSETFEKQMDAGSFLRTLFLLLADSGRMFIVMNNRFGIRYFCGDRDLYTDRTFDGIENYRRAYVQKEDTFAGRMYSCDEMREFLTDGGASPSHIKFYSVYPALNDPSFLYAEGYTPTEDLSNRIRPTYHYPKSVFLEEEALYNGLVKNGMFHPMANGYLVEVTKDEEVLSMLHVTSSLERGEKDALYTIIESESVVRKRAAYPEGLARIAGLSENLSRLRDRGIPVIEGRVENGSFVMPYINAPSGQMYLRALAERNIQEFIACMDHFRDLIMKSSELATPEEVEQFKADFRIAQEEKRKADAIRDGREYKPREIQKDFFDFDLGPVFKCGFMDMVPLNSFYQDGEFVFFDQEFCVHIYPAKAVLYRMVVTLYSRSVEMNKLITLDELLMRYDLYNARAKWDIMQSFWLDPVLNYSELYDYHKSVCRNADITSSNRQRMNYSEEDYQRIFVNLFEHADSRKLILFGTGQYARKFMKLYGNDYKIHCFVDNNESRWGQSFEGIPVENPEILKTFKPGEYKVIVCIKNYVSVIKQLNKLGVTEYSIYDTGMSYPKPRAPIAAPASTDCNQQKQYHVGYVAGVFDLFHIGHLNIFKRAKEYCDYLIVGVVSDEGVRENKKANPFVPFEERIEMVRSCRYVDEAVEIPHGFHDTEDAFKMYHFDVQFSGSDYANDKNWLDKQKYLRDHGADLVFFPYTQSTSSTKLKQTINNSLEAVNEKNSGKQEDTIMTLLNTDASKVVASIGGVCGNLRPKQGIQDLYNAGFKSVLLDFAKFTRIHELESIGQVNRKVNASLPDVAMEPNKLVILAQPFIKGCQDLGIEIPVGYAPYLPRDTKHTDLNDRLKELAKESIRLCSQAKTKYIVIRPLFAGVEYGDEWEVNKAFYLELAPLARENNVMILLENAVKNIHGHLVRGICSDGAYGARWVDELNEAVGEERFGFCMDVGVCNISGINMYDFALRLGDRLKVVTLTENNGDREQNILPFTQTAQTDYLQLFRGLRRIGYAGYLFVNFSSTAAAASPIIKPGILHFAKMVGDYFKWQIDIENMLRKYPKRVLFGAGNMCRNYMKCYGEDYPPMFTCDNNRNIWGNDFCGLEVKSPDALKTLPEDCAIFICNIYYREIQKQLREMGVTNPIEFFNDEYMPSFYFNRLEDLKS